MKHENDGRDSSPDGSKRRTRSEGSLSRRRFLGNSGLLVGATALGGVSPRLASAAPPEDAAAPPGPDDDLGAIPRRVLGRTGEKVSILGLGTACMGEGPQDADECASVFAEAIDRGINYIDTARIYKVAETAVGKVIHGRRDKVFLVTKVMEDTRAGAERSVERSFRELGVDHVDVLHLHSTGDRDLDKVLAPGGVWEYLQELKKAGRTRFVGITGHNRPEKFLRVLATDQVDVMMVAMNFVDRHTYGFEQKVLPAAREKKTGVMAMKVFGGVRGGFAQNHLIRPSQLDEIYLHVAVRYSLSLEGVTGVVIGVHNSAELRQNIRYVLNAPQLSEKEREALASHGGRLAEIWGPRFGPIA